MISLVELAAADVNTARPSTYCKHKNRGEHKILACFDSDSVRLNQTFRGPSIVEASGKNGRKWPGEVGADWALGTCSFVQGEGWPTAGAMPAGGASGDDSDGEDAGVPVPRLQRPEGEVSSETPGARRDLGFTHPCSRLLTPLPPPGSPAQPALALSCGGRAHQGLERHLRYCGSCSESRCCAVRWTPCGLTPYAARCSRGRSRDKHSRQAPLVRVSQRPMFLSCRRGRQAVAREARR